MDREKAKQRLQCYQIKIISKTTFDSIQTGFKKARFIFCIGTGAYSSKEWNRVVASMKRSPSSVKRESKVESTTSVPKSTEFYNQIGMFLKSSANDEDLRDGIKRRSTIAHARLVGMEALRNALDLEHVGYTGHIYEFNWSQCPICMGWAVPKVVHSKESSLMAENQAGRYVPHS